MDRAELRGIQGPIKAHYREEPGAAGIVLTAQGELGNEGVSCSVSTGKALVEAGLHPSTGGDGTLACSGDMLLEALVACAGVTMRAVAINRGIIIDSGTVRAEGDLDMRGTLGMDPTVPVGFTDIRLTFDVQTSASEEDVAALVATTERYCVVLQTLLNSPRVNVSATRA